MLRRLTAILVVVVASVLLPYRASGQQDSTARATTRVGLSSVGALTAHASFASIQRGYHGVGVGASADFGYIGAPRLRLLADVDYLLSFPETEFVEEEDRTYRDNFRDLSGTLSLQLHLNSPTARITPYVAGGLGVHVLSSSFGVLAIDTRYNTNNFGLLTAVGARIRTGSGGRRAVLVEGRRVYSQDVSRTSVHVGLTLLLGELARR